MHFLRQSSVNEGTLRHFSCRDLPAQYKQLIFGQHHTKPMQPLVRLKHQTINQADLTRATGPDKQPLAPLFPSKVSQFTLAEIQAAHTHGFTPFPSSYGYVDKRKNSTQTCTVFKIQT